MARGFESKSVEAQQEEAQRPRSERPALSAEERERIERRQASELALTTKRRELEGATSDAHRAYLKRAIDALEHTLSNS